MLRPEMPAPRPRSRPWDPLPRPYRPASTCSAPLRPPAAQQLSFPSLQVHRLMFVFARNPFFSNAVLTKSYPTCEDASRIKGERRETRQTAGVQGGDGVCLDEGGAERGLLMLPALL